MVEACTLPIERWAVGIIHDDILHQVEQVNIESFKFGHKKAGLREAEANDELKAGGDELYVGFRVILQHVQ